MSPSPSPHADARVASLVGTRDDWTVDGRRARLGTEQRPHRVRPRSDPRGGAGGIRRGARPGPATGVRAGPPPAYGQVPPPAYGQPPPGWGPPPTAPWPRHDTGTDGFAIAALV